jgi:citrate lyase subunit beta / citryl-CoA lyase
VKLRSLLFVPADSPRKLEKALGVGADALILDLEDSVAPQHKAAARSAIALWLRENEKRDFAAYVRINPVTTPHWRTSIAMLGGLVDGIMLPKAESLKDVIRVADALDEEGISTDIRILPIITETAASLFRFGTFANGHPRLSGITWGAEDLAADIGALSNKDEMGNYTGIYALARTLTLAAAAAACVAPIDSVQPDFRNMEALKKECRAARRDGFTGKMAIHPDQVPIINAAFTPSMDEIKAAKIIVEAFAVEPDAGVLSLNGRMLDKPHLRQAMRIIEQAT